MKKIVYYKKIVYHIVGLYALVLIGSIFTAVALLAEDIDDIYGFTEILTKVKKKFGKKYTEVERKED